jgi:uncharacterized protein (DUF488 family)
MRTLATIGYEGASPETFDKALLRAGVEMVIDVRAVAVSRKRGFSKTALSKRLEEHGLKYVHLRGLGDPKPGREAARAGNMTLFRTIFAKHLETDWARSDLAMLCHLTAGHRTVLLCYEADPADCHRSIVAQRIATVENLSIMHLRVDQGQNGSGRARANHSPGEGLAAA